MRNRSRIRNGALSLTKAIAKWINPVDTVRMQKTLDLSDVDTSVKPHINDIMPIIEEREEEEARQRNLEIARKWQNTCGVLFGGDDYGFEDEEDYFAYLRNQKKLQKLNKKSYGKRGVRGGSKKHKRNLYDYDLDNADDFWSYRRQLYGEDFNGDEKHIYYYPNIYDEGSAREFHSLSEFDKFCGEHGFVMGDTDYDNLRNWSVIHCCLDPIDLDYGDYAIITDNSYGALYWSIEGDMNQEKAEVSISRSN